MMFKIAIATGLMLSPALLLAQSQPLGGGMGTQADATPKSGSMSGTTGSAMHRSGARSTMHRKMGHTTRSTAPSNDTPSTQNTSNSKSGPLNSNPH